MVQQEQTQDIVLPCTRLVQAFKRCAPGILQSQERLLSSDAAAARRVRHAINSHSHLMQRWGAPCEGASRFMDFPLLRGCPYPEDGLDRIDCLEGRQATRYPYDGRLPRGRPPSPL